MDGTAEPAEDRLYGLMEVAERQQAAVQAALEGLAAERAALAREREALARGVAGLQSGMQGAVWSAVADSLAGAATEGVAAVQAATGAVRLICTVYCHKEFKSIHSVPCRTFVPIRD